jgi:hypothetical protein
VIEIPTLKEATMDINYLTLDREERISEIFPLPGGRAVFAELELLPTIPSGPSPAIADTLQLVVELRSTPDSEFEPVAQTSAVSAPRNYSVQVPTPAGR